LIIIPERFIVKFFYSPVSLFFPSVLRHWLGDIGRTSGL